MQYTAQVRQNGEQRQTKLFSPTLRWIHLVVTAELSGIAQGLRPPLEELNEKDRTCQLELEDVAEGLGRHKAVPKCDKAKTQARLQPRCFK